VKSKKLFIIFILIIILGISIFLIFYKKNMAKNFKIGNNTTSQEIVDYILNISSYEATIEVDVKSNKNENKYIIKQNYNGEADNTQEVLEPSNIAGVKIVRDGKSLKLENTNLNLSSIFKNYEGLAENDLDLSSFIQEYKEDKKASFKEKNDEILMQTSGEENEKRAKNLYISKETGMPTKMEVQDTNKNIVIYILYREVTVNS
jgi:outer membrane lipoprotein-sorting protein